MSVIESGMIPDKVVRGGEQDGKRVAGDPPGKLPRSAPRDSRPGEAEARAPLFPPKTQV